MSPTSANDRPPPPQTLSSDLVAVVFTWHEDRWVHALHARAPNGSHGPACWRTAMALPDEDPCWPWSPPLVELAEVACNAGPALVGVGRAGKSHYSVSITTEVAGTVRFDFACRLVTAAGWLGSTYQQVAANPPALVIEPLEGASAEAISAASAGPPAGRHLLQIRPPAADDTPGGGEKSGVTTLWSYRIGVAEAG